MRLPRLGNLVSTGKRGGAENPKPSINIIYFLLATAKAACYTAGMAAWRLRSIRNQQISVLLIVALLFITIWPAHFHVHHAEVEGKHGHVHKHVVDLHADAKGIDTAHHQDAQVLKASPDGMLKTPLVKVLPFLLLAIALAVLATITKRLIITPRQRHFFPSGYLTCHSPPLRGPPSIA
jgi:hypothetical protein